MDSVRVGYQGEAGAYSEEAILRLLGEGGIEPVPCTTFAEVFDRLQAESVTLAMLPVENSYAGDVGDVYDLLRRYQVRIHAELELPVRHHLLALPGVSFDDIAVVRSHPQALGQCAQFIRGRNLRAEPSYDTAGAAREVAALGRRDVAAIASKRAAVHYGLDILAGNIQDAADNVTRFYLLSLPEASSAPAGSLVDQTARRLPGNDSSGRYKTTVSFTVSHRPGALHHCLGAFAEAEVNLTKLTSRPHPGRSWEYMFFADLEGQAVEARVSVALAELERRAVMLRVFGSFPCFHADEVGHG